MSITLSTSNASPVATPPLTRDIARKVLATVDAGLVSGLGKPIPGQMCVEAAVCYAYGLPHSDEPPCVAPAVRALKISLNDHNWSSNAARAKGMRRLAIIQLGTAGVLDERLFAARLAEMTIRKVVPRALRTAAKLLTGTHKEVLENAAARCEVEGTRAAAYAAADAAADAADAAARAAADAADAAAYAADAAAYAADAADAAAFDETLSTFAEAVVQLLVEMGAPAAQYLDLAPL